MVRKRSVQLKNFSLVSAPFFAPRLDTNAAGMDAELMRGLVDLNNASYDVLDYQAPCWPGGASVYDADVERWACPAYRLPDATLLFQALALPNATSPTAKLAYTMQVNDNTITRYHRPSNFSRLGLPFIPTWATQRTLTIDPARVATMDALTRAYLSLLEAAHDDAGARGVGVPRARVHIVPPTVVAVGTFPDVQVTNFLQFVEVIGAVLYPIALTLQLPLFVFITVLEKEERLVELQRAMGLRYTAYVSCSYLLNFALYAVVVAFFWGAGRALQFTLFTGTSQALLLACFVGWGLALCSMAQLLSTFLWTRIAATVVGYVVALFGNLFAIIIAAGVYGYSLPISLQEAMPDWLYMFPMFGLVRFMYLTSFNCISKVACFSDAATALAPGSELRSAVVSMYIVAVIMLLAALYLDQVLPRKHGVRKPLCFCLPARWWHGATALATAPPKPALDYRALGGGVHTSDSADVHALYAYLRQQAAARRATVAHVARTYIAGEDGDVRQHRVTLRDAIFPRMHTPAVQSARGAERPASMVALAREYPIIFRHLRKEFAVPQSGGSRWGASAWPCLVRATPDARSAAKAHDDQASALLQLSSMSDEEDDIGAPTSSNLLDVRTPGGVYEEAEQAAFLRLGVKVAVSDFSLAIERNTTFGALGENGAGKTTLLSMLMGLFPPTAGAAYVNGYDVSRQSDAARKSLGVCMQHDILWPTLTVEEHLRYYARLKAGSTPKPVDVQVHEAMDSVGLRKFAARYARDLSGGMRRRLSLAIALVGDSPIILADEITTG
ncbi:MAG: ATP-binding cassette domain-containing protein, partial [Methanosarcinales archaeon]